MIRVLKFSVSFALMVSYQGDRMLHVTFSDCAVWSQSMSYGAYI